MGEEITTSILPCTNSNSKKEGDSDPQQEPPTTPPPLQLNSQGRCFSCLKDSSVVTISTAFRPLSDILSRLEVPLEETICQLLPSPDSSSAASSSDTDGGVKNLLKPEVEVKLCHNCSETYGGLSDLFRKLEKAKRKLKKKSRADDEIQNNENDSEPTPKSKRRKLSKSKSKVTAEDLTKKVNKISKKLRQALVSVRNGIEAGNKSGLLDKLAITVMKTSNLGAEDKKHISVVEKLRKDIKGKCETRNIEAMFGGGEGGSDENSRDRIEELENYCEKEEKPAIVPCDSTTTDCVTINLKVETPRSTEIVTVDLSGEDIGVTADPVTNPIPSSTLSNTSQVIAPIPSTRFPGPSPAVPPSVWQPMRAGPGPLPRAPFFFLYPQAPPPYRNQIPWPGYYPPISVPAPSFNFTPSGSGNNSRPPASAVPAAPAQNPDNRQPPPSASTLAAKLCDPALGSVVMKKGVPHFACTICKRVLSSTKGLATHHEAKHIVTSITCNYCNSVIEGIGSDYSEHRRVCRKGQKRARDADTSRTCEHCLKAIEGSISNFVSHKANCRRKAQHKCLSCTAVFSSLQLLQDHLRNCNHKKDTFIKITSHSSSTSTTTAAAGPAKVSAPPRPTPMTQVSFPLRCITCHRTFYDAESREQHYRAMPSHRMLNSVFR